jgi:hypothetical protein
VSAFVGCVAMGLLMGIPEPRVHDEFSYLLAADTFAHGRLTNPTHPMWVHFETMHVIHQPTYMSKYPPAQGLVLALGQTIGHPIIGVWLAIAFMCAVICWMLQAWLPYRWALLGGLIVIVHPSFGVGSTWARSYWGGAVAASGGALLLGGARYLMRQPQVGYSLAVGLGLVILAFSRPYEGLVLSVPVGFGMLVWLLGKNRPSFGLAFRRVIFPIVAVVLVGASALGFYNYRVAGHPFRLPYLVHEDAYNMSAYFIWQSLPPKPNYRHPVIEKYHEDWELKSYLERRSLTGFIRSTVAAMAMYAVLSGSVFWIPLIGSARSLIAWFWNNRWGRLAILTYGFFVLGLVMETYSMFYYWAPVLALNILFIVQGARFWFLRDQQIGKRMLYFLPPLALAVVAANSYQTIKSLRDMAPQLQRARLLTQLKRQNGRHIVIVNYGPNHSYDREWVYNEADIDGSKVVWARDMGLAENCKLIDYFKDRVTWFLEIDHDEDPVKLAPFPKPSCHSTPSPHKMSSG